MKRYEKMGFDTEAALKWVEECKKRKCADCPALYHRPGSPAFCATSYLLSEAPQPPKVPRWQTIKTQKDIYAIHDTFRKMCDTQGCAGCKYHVEHDGFGECIFRYLLELVEVQE